MICENVITCAEDNPLRSIVIESADDLVYTGISRRMPRMPLGETWGAFGTMQTATSLVSQAQADLDADALANAVAASPPNATPPEIQQTCATLNRDPVPLGDSEHTIGRDRCCICTKECPQPILGEQEEVIFGEGGEFVIGE